MAAWNRAGTGLLFAGGLGLAVLMVSLLVGNGSSEPSGLRDEDRRGDPNVDDVFVFLERGDWDDFRRGIETVVREGRAGWIEARDESVVLETLKRRRRVRFSWIKTRGQIEARTEVRRRAEGSKPPLAIVGASNTAITAALAEGLRDAKPIAGKRTGPALLIPLATAVEVGSPIVLMKTADARVRLLNIHPGRTFRFCLDNRRLAESAVRCLWAREPDRPPRRVSLVVDRHDPCSRDLAACFQAAVAQLPPTVQPEVVETPLREEGPLALDDLPRGDGIDTPGPSEQALAEKLCRESIEVSENASAWVVLTLQRDPLLTMLRALSNQAWYHFSVNGETARLRVLAGDGIGLDILRRQARGQNLPFTFWIVSSGLGRETLGRSDDLAQIPGEIVAAILYCVDRVARDSPDDFLETLRTVNLAKDSPSAMGRPIAFDSSGERRGSFGLVLEAQPGNDAPIVSYALDADGKWIEAALPERLPEFHINK